MSKFDIPPNSEHIHAEAKEQWNKWLDEHYAELCMGMQLTFPKSLPHPVYSGFKRIRMAENVGQRRDWALSLKDGARIHIHDFGNNRMVVHRDRYDPAKGIFSSLAHWLTEAASGKLALDIFFGRHKAITAHADRRDAAKKGDK